MRLLLPVTNIVWRPGRWRSDDGDVAYLRKSIETYGLRHPPVVRALGVTGDYALVGGERRLRVLLAQGRRAVQVTVRPTWNGLLDWLAEDTRQSRSEPSHEEMRWSERDRYVVRLLDVYGDQRATSTSLAGPLGVTYDEIRHTHYLVRFTAHDDPRVRDEALRQLELLDAGRVAPNTAQKVVRDLVKRGLDPDGADDGACTTSRTRSDTVDARRQRTTLAQATAQLTGIAHGLEGLLPLHGGLTPDECAAWYAELRQSRTRIDHVVRALRERVR